MDVNGVAVESNEGDNFSGNVGGFDHQREVMYCMSSSGKVWWTSRTMVTQDSFHYI